MRVLVLSVNVAHSMTIKRFRLIKKGGLKNYFSEKKKTSRLNTVVNNLVPSSGCWCVDIQKGPELMRRGGSLTFPPRFRPLMSPAGRSLTSGPPAVRADNADPRCTGAGVGGWTMHITQDARPAWEMMPVGRSVWTDPSGGLPPSYLINIPPSTVLPSPRLPSF